MQPCLLSPSLFSSIAWWCLSLFSPIGCLAHTCSTAQLHRMLGLNGLNCRRCRFFQNWHNKLMRSPVGLLLWTRVCVQRCSFLMLSCYIFSVSIFCQCTRIQVHLHLVLNYHHLFHVALHLVLTCIYFHTPRFHRGCFSTSENTWLVIVFDLTDLALLNSA